MNDDPLKWLRRGGALFVLLVGWAFIAWQNHRHFTAPVVFVGLAYLAVVATVYNLWRTGAAAVAPESMLDAWEPPPTARGELEKEMKTLLKAIKEAEFDLQMGKLSKQDADGMIATYRARAIEVIKEIERLEGTGQTDAYGRIVGGETVREKIAKEVKARIELAGAKKKDKGKGKGKKGEGQGDEGRGKEAKA